MIKAIIFDVGGVLIRTEDPGHRRRLEARFGLAPGGAEQLVFNSEMGIKAQQGQITDQQLWQWIGEHLALSTEETAAFRRQFWAGDVLDSALVTMIRRLQTRYQTAIISNATDALRRALTETHRIADAFDLIVGSAEEKVMKPDPRIYRRTLERLGRQPEEAVFIDDFPHNIEAARALGLHAIQFTAQTNLAQELATLGIRIPIDEPQ